MDLLQCAVTLRESWPCRDARDEGVPQMGPSTLELAGTYTCTFPSHTVCRLEKLHPHSGSLDWGRSQGNVQMLGSWNQTITHTSSGIPGWARGQKRLPEGDRWKFNRPCSIVCLQFLSLQFSPSHASQDSHSMPPRRLKHQRSLALLCGSEEPL